MHIAKNVQKVMNEKMAEAQAVSINEKMAEAQAVSINPDSGLPQKIENRVRFIIKLGSFTEKKSSGRTMAKD